MLTALKERILHEIAEINAWGLGYLAFSHQERENLRELHIDFFHFLISGVEKDVRELRNHWVMHSDEINYILNNHLGFYEHYLKYKAVYKRTVPVNMHKQYEQGIQNLEAEVARLDSDYPLVLQ